MNASAAPKPSSPPASVDQAEATHFGKLAEDWWDPRGSSAMLHRLNPARLGYIRQATDSHWGLDAKCHRPFSGKFALDIGCGAGLLAEPLARLGATTTGIDAAAENIEAAGAHAALSDLAIDYRCGGIEAATGSYDLITCLEVIEHVTDPKAFVAGLASVLAPGGLLILSTPNRTAASRVAMITVGERTGLIPKGTHDWNKFLTPEELREMLEDTGLTIRDVSGLSFSPSRGFEISRRKALNYFVTASF
jgi:2-polyprenyl-6-hydroxyphenyl methylase/3-demethylubiquinone-9 3-methyltransferase